MRNQLVRIPFFFFLVPLVSYGVPLAQDSLLPEVDTAKVRVLNELANELTNSNPPKAIAYARQALQFAQSTNYIIGKGNAFENLGAIYHRLSLFDSSVFYLNKAILVYSDLAQSQKGKGKASALLKLSRCYYSIATVYYDNGRYELAIEHSFKSKDIEEKIENPIGVAVALKQIGCCYHLLGKYTQAIDYVLQALRIFEQNNDYQQISNCYNDIGSFYTEQKDYGRALDCFRNALKINIDNNREDTTPDIYTNIGSALLNSGKADESLEYYGKALKLYSQQNNEKGIATVYSNLAYAFKSLHRYSESIDYNLKAIELMKRIDFKMGIVYTCCNISELYNLAGNYSKSIEYGEEALRLSRTLKILYIEAQANLSLSVAYQNLRNVERALSYYKVYSGLKDSVLTIEKQKQIAEMQVRYETETIQKQKQIAEQERELLKVKTSKQKAWVRFMLLITVITSIFTVVLLIQARVQKKLNRILVQKNREVLESEQQLYAKKKELEEVIDSLKEQSPNSKNSYVEKYAQSRLQKTEERLFIEKLERLMVEDKLFLQCDLSLDKLAKLLDSNRSYISQVINDNYKQNFSNFLNQYRVKEACNLLADPKNQVKTIEGIAKEVGFNSITTFNRCFKKQTGVNPSFYLKAQQ